MNINTIEPAQKADAKRIYDLLVEAFGHSYLQFTVYESPKSVRFIQDQIEKVHHDSRVSFRVMRYAGIPIGFYSAVERNGEYFLNYIAMGVGFRETGAGRFLLRDFEAEGALRNCNTLGLDVFRSNTMAVSWYERHGYRYNISRFRGRFELFRFESFGEGELEVDSVLINRASAEEEIRGCSSVACVCLGTPIRLGLIAGSVCNLLEPVGCKGLAVAPAIARYFKGQRQWLLAGSDEPFIGWPKTGSMEESVYMTKNVEDREFVEAQK